MLEAKNLREVQRISKADRPAVRVGFGTDHNRVLIAVQAARAEVILDLGRKFAWWFATGAAAPAVVTPEHTFAFKWKPR